MRKSLVVFFALILCLGCNSDDESQNCAVVSCLSSPLNLQFLSSDTGEDLFGNGTFDKDAFQVTNALSEDLVQGGFVVVVEAIEEYYSITEAVQNSGPRKYRFVLANQFDFTVSYDVSFRNIDDCCPSVIRKNVVFQETVMVEATAQENTYKLLF